MSPSIIKLASETVIVLADGGQREAWQLREGDRLAGGIVVLADAIATHGELERVILADGGFKLRIAPEQGVVLGGGVRYRGRRSLGACSTLRVSQPILTLRVDGAAVGQTVTFTDKPGLR